MINENYQYVDEIIEKIDTKNCVLFLGAGASICAGGKTWTNLTENIKKNFSKIDFDTTDFFEICEDISQTYPYNRNDLVSYLHKELGDLKPSPYHNILTKYDWGAIFTTNYDDVIEESYRNKDKLKPCHPYVKADISFDYGKDKIKLFKVMGCIRYLNEDIDNGGLVLTQSDYDYNLSLKTKYFDILYDILKNGTVLFIGYSFADKIIDRLLNLIFRNERLEKLPWSYYISPENINSKKQNMLNSKKIKHLKMGFEDFMTQLDNRYKIERISKDKEHIVVNIKGENHLIDKEEYVKDYADYIEIMYENLFNMNNTEPSKDNFFRGIDKSFLPFIQNWDVERDIYIKSNGDKLSLKDRIFLELTNEELNEPRHNSLILIEGDAGAGKTVLLKRIAYDIYTELNQPALILKNLKNAYDPKLISDLIFKVTHKEYRDLTIKVAIIIDDVAKNIRQVINLKNILSGMGVSALFIVADRSNEIEPSLEEDLIFIGDDSRYRLSDSISEEEKERLFTHLEELGYIFSKELINQEVQEYNSFFALMYSLVDPTHQPLEQSVRLQYYGLSPKMQEIYLLIAMFYQFNISINVEWLLRIIRMAYSDFYDNYINSEGKGILIEEQDEKGNIFFRLHHRIIAEVLIKLAYIDKEQMKDTFVKAFSVVNLQNIVELSICKKLVYYNFKVKSDNCVFDYEQVEELFRTLGKNNKYRFIYHHWGILETQKGLSAYPEAERLLKKALKSEEDEDFIGRESASGVLTSLGTLYSKWYTEENENDLEKLKKAEQCFVEAKGGTKNIHPYHAHANMYYQLGNHEALSEKKYDYYSKSLAVISKAKNVLNEEDLQRIIELELKAYSRLNNETDEIINVLETKYSSLKGYFIKALFLYIEAQKSDNTEKAFKAYDILNCLFEEGKIDEECLRLQLNIYFKYKQVDFGEAYNILFKWYNLSRESDDIYMLYHLGVCAFNLKKYMLAKEVFKRLDKLSNGYKLRSKPNFTIKNGKESEIFEGEVVSVNYESNIGFIKCLNLKGYEDLFQFRPYLVKKHSIVSKGVLVNFNIAFNYRGPLALNISKK